MRHGRVGHRPRTWSEGWPVHPRLGRPPAKTWVPGPRPGMTMTERCGAPRPLGTQGTLTLTYDPGASSIGFSLPAPGCRAGTIVLSCDTTQRCQSGHHDP